MASGHIYRRTLKDGRASKWYAVIDTNINDGSRKQVTKAFLTKREAQEWLASAALDRARPEPVGPTLAEYLPQWLDGKVGLKPTTLASYRAHIERCLVPMLGHLRLQQLTPQDAARWHRELMDAGVDPATIARVHATLSSALATARRQGLITANPLAGVELPRRIPYRHRTWTRAEASTVACRSPRSRPPASTSSRTKAPPRSRATACSRAASS